jgi:hypothetical protein
MQLVPRGTEAISQAFDVPPPQMRSLNELLDRRSALHDQMFDPQVDTPEEWAPLRREFDFVNRQLGFFSRQLKRKPPQPRSAEQVITSGGSLEPGRAYSIGDPKTATRGILFTGRSVNEFPIRRSAGLVESPNMPGTFFQVDADGKQTFAARRVGDKLRGVGEPFVHPDFPGLGPVQHEPDGTLKQIGKDKDDTVGEVMKSLVKQTDSGGDLVVMEQLRPQKGETQADATKRFRGTIAGMATAIVGAQRDMEKAVRTAEFADRYEGSPNFNVIYTDLLKGDEELAKWDGVLKKIGQISATRQQSQGTPGAQAFFQQAIPRSPGARVPSLLTPEEREVQRGAAIIVLAKLKRMEDDVAALDDYLVREYLERIAQLRAVAGE